MLKEKDSAASSAAASLWDPPKDPLLDREIFLSRNFEALVEIRDWHRLSFHPSGKPKHWSVDIHLDGRIYAVRTGTLEDGLLRGKKIYLHREVMEVVSEPFVEVDHQRHNGLDNRRRQLRILDREGNGNHTRQKIGATGIRGVTKRGEHRKLKKPFEVRHKFRGVTHFLGYFESEVEAGIAYNKSVIEKLAHLPIDIIRLRLNYPLDVGAEKLLARLEKKKKREEDKRQKPLRNEAEEIPF